MMRKAEASGENLVAMILIIGGLVLLTFVGMRMLDALWSVEGDVDCYAQVMTHSSIAKYGRKVYLPINCPTSDHNFTSSDTNEEVLGTVAEQMRLCWKKWGEGRLELFPDDGIYCHYCSYIDFRETERPLTGLFSYLSNETTPSGEFYIDYLSATRSRGSIAELEEYQKSQEFQSVLAQDSFSAEKPHVILFVYGKGDTAINKLFNYMLLQNMQAQAAGGASMLAAGVAGAATAKVALTVLGASTPVGWAIAAGATVGVGTYVALDTLLAHFDPEDYSSKMAFTLFAPLDEEVLRDQLGCQFAFSTITRPEGFYTHTTKEDLNA